MSYTKKQEDLKTKKYSVEPELIDTLIDAYLNQRDDLMAVASGKCDPDELKYALARLAGWRSTILFLQHNMNKESLDGLRQTIRGEAGPRPQPCGACPAREGSEDRGDSVCTGSCPHKQSADRDQQSPQPQPKDPWYRRWLRK